MTNDDIIKFAREAGFVWSLLQVVDKHRMERFATLVADSAAAKEREACAALCDDMAQEEQGKVDRDYSREDTAEELAALIRARGQQ